MDLRASEKVMIQKRSYTVRPPESPWHHLLNQNAFTLMEVLVAILVLAGSLMTLLGMQTAIIERTIGLSSEAASARNWTDHDDPTLLSDSQV